MIHGNVDLEVHWENKGCWMCVPPCLVLALGGNAPLSSRESPAPLGSPSLPPARMLPTSPMCPHLRSPCLAVSGVPAVAPSSLPTLSAFLGRGARQLVRTAGLSVGRTTGLYWGLSHRPRLDVGIWEHRWESLGPRCCPQQGTARLRAEDQRQYDFHSKAQHTRMIASSLLGILNLGRGRVAGSF